MAKIPSIHIAASAKEWNWIFFISPSLLLREKYVYKSWKRIAYKTKICSLIRCAYKMHRMHAYVCYEEKRLVHTVASSRRLAKKSNNEPERMIAKRKRARDAALKMHNAKYISREYLPLLLFFLARGHRLPFCCRENLCFNNWQCNCELC